MCECQIENTSCGLSARIEQKSAKYEPVHLPLVSSVTDVFKGRCMVSGNPLFNPFSTPGLSFIMCLPLQMSLKPVLFVICMELLQQSYTIKSKLLQCSGPNGTHV